MTLSLTHSLGYGGDPLHYAGGGSFVFASGNVVKRLTWENGTTSSTSLKAEGIGVGTLAMHPNRTHLVMAERGNQALVSLFSHDQDGNMVREDELPGAGLIDIDCMCFAADGQSLVTVSSLPDFKVAVWDWANDRETPIAAGTAPGEVKQCGFNPVNPYQLAFSGGGILYICKLVTANAGQEQELELDFLAVQTPTSDVTYVSMVWSGDGRLFATTTDGGLWNIDLQQCVVAGDSTVISADAGVKCNLLATEEHIICWCSDGSIAWIGLKTLAEGHRIKMPLADGVSLVSACLADGRFESLFVGASYGSLYYLEVKQRMPDGAFEENEEEPSAVTIKDADAICGEVQSCSHHSLKRIVTSHGAHINSICPANTGDTVASAGKDGSVIIWDSLSGLPLAVQRIGRPVTSLASHPFEPLLAAGDTAGFVYMVDVGLHSKLKCRSNFRLFKEPIAALSFNDDGSLLAVVAEESNQLYIISVRDKTQEVMGFMHFPLQGSFVRSVRWVASRHVVVADNEGYLLACTDIPGKDGETLKLKAVFTAIKTGQGGVAAFSNLGDQLVVSTTSHKHVRSFSAFQGWGRVITPDDLSGLAETKPTRQWMDHAKRVQALSTLPGGDMLATCSLDGSVFIRAAAETSMKALGVRVSSVWTGGSSAVTIFRKDNKATVVACGGCDGSINILSTEPHHLKGKSISVAAQSTSQRLMDALGEHVDLHTDEPTFVEKQLMADREMENALNAAKKNAFRDSIRKQKVSLDELLQQNADAPEIERISRDQIVVDEGMRQSIIAAGDARVLKTQASIAHDNKSKDTRMSRIKTLAWESMDVHGAQVRGFQSDAGVFNYPIQKLSEEDAAELKIITTQRRMEINVASLQRREMGVSNSLINLDNHVAPDLGIALAADAPPPDAQGEGENGKVEATEDESEEAWRKRQHEPLMYHRLEATTRERKTAQVILLQQVMRKVKGEFNSTFEDFLKKKGQSLGRVEEKMSRMLEIHSELKSVDIVDKPALADSEQPEKVLVVEEHEIKVEKWVSLAEIKAKADEEKRMREAAGSDDTAERALNQMMGGSLAGQSAQGKLEQTMEKPLHLIPAVGEELLEDRAKELKEWETQYKAFIAEQEAYARQLDSEAKKLRTEMMEEMKKFDESLLELAAARMETDYKVYELELYKMKLMLAIAQEEDDVLVQRSLKSALEQLVLRRETAVRAFEDYQGEVGQAEDELQAARDEVAILEKQFVKEIVNPIHVNNKDLSEFVLKAYKKRGDMNELLDHGLTSEELKRGMEHLDIAREQDDLVEGLHVNLEVAQQELARLEEVAQQILASIDSAEVELEELESRMATMNSNLDLTLSVKQGQVEVEQAAVVTDFSEALVVETSCIESHNSAISTRGNDKIAVLHEIKDFRKGIHGLQWENQRLDLEEEDLLQRTKDLQLLRVTKNLQSIIKGGDHNKDATESASLERLIAYQVTSHKTRVAEKFRSRVQLLQAQARGCQKENQELDEDIFALESAVVERQRLCELQGTNTQQPTQTTGKRSGPPPRNPKETAKMNMMVTHRKLLDLAKAQTREIELMREELVRLRARTFPSFAQLSDHPRALQDVGY